MSRTTRTAFLALLVAALPVLLLVSGVTRAHAQEPTRDDVPGRYHLSVLANGAGWIITDSETGAFEVWGYDPSGPAYQVRGGQYRGTALTIRLVPLPRSAR